MREWAKRPHEFQQSVEVVHSVSGPHELLQRVGDNAEENEEEDEDVKEEDQRQHEARDAQ